MTGSASSSCKSASPLSVLFFFLFTDLFELCTQENVTTPAASFDSKHHVYEDLSCLFVLCSVAAFVGLMCSHNIIDYFC